jgi:CBS domain-containing protein
MKVSDWIGLHPALPVTIPPDVGMEAVAETFLSHPDLRDMYIVSGDGTVLGFIRHRRLAQILLSEYLPIQSRHQIIERVSGGSARELMEADFVSAHPEEQLDNVLNRMLEYEVEDMPVLDDRRRIVGNINLTEVLRAVRERGL